MKKFLIIGNKNAVIAKDTFKMIMGGDIFPSTFKNFIFDTPDGEKTAACCWFTNIANLNLNKPDIALKKYSPDQFPTYDNFNAIHCANTANIADYDGIIAVPISFLNKHNYKQFEIVGITARYSDKYRTRTYTSEFDRWRDMNGTGVIMRNDQPELKYARLLIKKKMSDFPHFCLL